jgi:hypothetical protein
MGMAQDDIQSDDRTTLQQREASADVFEDGQNRSIDGPIRPMKDGESYVYGDSRPDDREDRGGFVNFEQRPEEFIHREEKFEAPMGDAEFIPTRHEGDNLEIRPRYRTADPEGAEEAVLVEKEAQ